MRTINGKKLDDVFRELQADFPKRDIKKHKSTQKWYVPVEKIKERLDAVLGVDNWCFVPTSSPELWKLGPESYESCVMTGKLVFYDDDRVPIERCAGGGSDIIYPKGEKRPTSVANAVDTAYQDVFKRCCRRFGIAKLNQNNGQNTESGEMETTSEPIQMEVTVLGVFQALSRGGAKVQVQYQEENLSLMIWATQWEELKRTFGGTFQIGKKINCIKFWGKMGVYQGKKRIEFCQLARMDRKCAG